MDKELLTMQIELVRAHQEICKLKAVVLQYQALELQSKEADLVKQLPVVNVPNE